MLLEVILILVVLYTWLGKLHLLFLHFLHFGWVFWQHFLLPFDQQQGSIHSSNLVPSTSYKLFTLKLNRWCNNCLSFFCPWSLVAFFTSHPSDPEAAGTIVAAGGGTGFDWQKRVGFSRDPDFRQLDGVINVTVVAFLGHSVNLMA